MWTRAIVDILKTYVGKLLKVHTNRFLFQLLYFRLSTCTYIILARNYKSCYALDVMHLKNSETCKVCRRRCTNHIRISLGNYGSLTSQLNLSFYLVRSVFFYGAGVKKKHVGNLKLKSNLQIIFIFNIHNLYISSITTYKCCMGAIFSF